MIHLRERTERMRRIRLLVDLSSLPELRVSHWRGTASTLAL
jgi:hypothetical protein